MTFKGFSEDIKPDRIGATTPIGQDQKPLSTPTESFKSYMQPSEAGAQEAGKTGLTSPFELGHAQANLAAGPNLETLATQAKFAHSTLGDIETQLKTPNLKLKQSTRYLLKNKLSEANAHLRAANSKLGVGEIAPPNLQAGAGPIDKFLNFVVDGQNQLQAAQGMLHNLSNQPNSLNPGQLMLIQIKLNTAQQNLEYSSVILSKAMDDLKMLMNLQI